MEERHTYTIKPRRPIRNLVKGKIFIKPTNLLLSKDEVLMCLTHGPVYRKFYLDGTERVTPSNLDRLHRSEHLTEEQYRAIVGTVNDSTIDTGFVHYEKQQVSEDITEVNEEVSEDEILEDNTEESEEDPVDEIIEETSTETEPVLDSEENPSFYDDIDEESKKVEEEQSTTTVDEDESSAIDDFDVPEYNNYGTSPVVGKKKRRRSKKKYPNSDVNVPMIDTTEVNE